MTLLPKGGVKHIITHANCPDGIASAMILHNAFPEATVELIQYQSEEHRNLEPTPGTLFCDITPAAHDAVHPLSEFIDAGVTVLDHHATQREAVEAFGDRGWFEFHSCGAQLARDFASLWHRSLPLASRGFSELVAVRDLWMTNSPLWDEACAVSAALLFYGFEELSDSPYLPDWALLTGKIIRDRNQSIAEEIAVERRYHILNGSHGTWAVLPAPPHGNVSDTANAVLRNQSIAVACVYQDRMGSEGPFRTYSLRSREGGVDVGTICRAHGGGGHKCAAGFHLPIKASAVADLTGAISAPVVITFYPPT